MKDGWDKVAATSGALSFVSGILIAAVGGFFTYSYNQRQVALDTEMKRRANEVSELEAFQKLIPSLISNNQLERTFALTALHDLGRGDFAAHIAEKMEGAGALNYLIAETYSGDVNARKAAAKALQSIAANGTPTDSAMATKALSSMFARYRDSVFHVPEAQIELSTQLSDLQAKYDSVVKENETLKKSALLKPTARGSGATVSAAAPAPEDGKDATKDPSEQSTANNTENLVGPFIGSLLTVNGETCTISTEAKTIENQNYVRLFGLAPGSDLYVSLDGASGQAVLLCQRNLAIGCPIMEATPEQ